jgi:tyrosyl-tRNA synthetase
MKNTDARSLLLRGAAEIIVQDELEAALDRGQPLKIKYGIDPTADRIHIGRAATMRHLKHFQDLGHEIHIVIGSFTGQIGDSSDKDTERPMLTREQVVQNMEHYQQQLAHIFDTSRMSVHYNGDWFEKMSLAEFFKLQQLFSVAQMIERDNFTQRFTAHERIGLHEFSYALLQGYDSVELQADVEIGGTDQLFNLLAGRTVQKAYMQSQQHIITYELLMGTDGRKMSTSWGNCIYVDDEPTEMYGKIMTVNDELMWDYFRLVTELPDDELADIKQRLDAGQQNRELKGLLARTITEQYHNNAAALEAEAAFTAQFQDNQLPEDIPELTIQLGNRELVSLLVEVALAPSNSAAKRLIDQGAIRHNQEKTQAETIDVRDGDVLQAGKRRYVRIRG